MTDRADLRVAVVAAAASCAAGTLAGTTLGTGIGIALALAALAFLRVCVRLGRLTRQLRARTREAEVAGAKVRLGPVDGSVFVAGLVRPSIFCDDALLAELDEGEISAVTLHERAHQLARDPLSDATVAVIAPVLRRFRRGSEWLERRAAAREVAADRYAMTHGADRRAIASALFKVPAAGRVGTSAFSPAAELRLRALLGDEVDLPRPRPSWSVAIGAALGLVACLVMPLTAGMVTGVMQTCCL